MRGGLHAEVADGDGRREIDAGEQPADDHAEQPHNAEQDQRAAGVATNAEHQREAEQEQKGEKADRCRPSDAFEELHRLKKSQNELKITAAKAEPVTHPNIVANRVVPHIHDQVENLLERIHRLRRILLQVADFVQQNSDSGLVERRLLKLFQILFQYLVPDVTFQLISLQKRNET